MSTLTSYNGLEVVSPTPLSGAGGAAINNNFIALSTTIAASDPTASDDSTLGYSKGSRWYNSTTTAEWVCTDPTASAAVWKVIASGAYLPLAGGTMSGTLNMGGGSITNGGAATFGGLVTVNGPDYGTFKTSAASVNTTTIEGLGTSGQAVLLFSTPDITGSHDFDIRNSGSGLAFRDDAAGVYRMALNIYGQIVFFGSEILMNDGSGSGGGAFSMDGGQIIQMRAENASSAPSSPNPGQIYFDTTSNHFFGWNGTAWKQLDN